MRLIEDSFNSGSAFSSRWDSESKTCPKVKQNAADPTKARKLRKENGRLKLFEVTRGFVERYEMESVNLCCTDR